MVPQPVNAIEVLRTARAASAAGQAVVAPRVLADADVALRAPAVEVVRVGRAAAAAAAARPCNRSCNGESVRGTEGAPHYAAARAVGCRSRGGGDRGRNPTPAAVAAAAVVPQPVIGVLRTVRAASAAGQAIVDPRVLADADVALRAPAVEVVRVGRAAAAKPCKRSCKGESVRGSEGAPHMPLPGQVAADPAAEAIGAATRLGP